MSYVRIKVTASFSFPMRLKSSHVSVSQSPLFAYRVLLICRNLAILISYLAHFLLSELRKYLVNTYNILTESSCLLLLITIKLNVCLFTPTGKRYFYVIFTFYVQGNVQR